MSNSIALPFPYFADPNRGRPIFNGQIFVGLPDVDPEIPANQIPVSYIDENGDSIALTQPIRTNSGGYPINSNGDVVSPQVGQSYSMKVLDRTGSQDFYIPSITSDNIEILNLVTGGIVYLGSNGQNVEVGDVVPKGTTHIRVETNSGFSILEMFPKASGSVSSISNFSATIGGVDVQLISSTRSKKIEGSVAGIIYNDQSAAASNFEVITRYANIGGWTIVITDDLHCLASPASISNGITLEFSEGKAITWSGTDAFQLDTGAYWIEKNSSHVLGSGNLQYLSFSSRDNYVPLLMFDNSSFDGDFYMRFRSDLDKNPEDPNTDEFGFGLVEFNNLDLKNRFTNFFTSDSLPYRKMKFSGTTAYNWGRTIFSLPVQNNHPFYRQVQRSMRLCIVEDSDVRNPRSKFGDIGTTAFNSFYHCLCLWEGNKMVDRNNFCQDLKTQTGIPVYDIYLAGLDIESQGSRSVDIYGFNNTSEPNTGVKFKKAMNANVENKQFIFTPTFFSDIEATYGFTADSSQADWVTYFPEFIEGASRYSLKNSRIEMPVLRNTQLSAQEVEQIDYQDNEFICNGTGQFAIITAFWGSDNAVENRTIRFNNNLIYAPNCNTSTLCNLVIGDDTAGMVVDLSGNEIVAQGIREFVVNTPAGSSYDITEAVVDELRLGNNITVTQTYDCITPYNRYPQFKKIYLGITDVQHNAFSSGLRGLSMQAMPNSSATGKFRQTVTSSTNPFHLLLQFRNPSTTYVAEKTFIFSGSIIDKTGKYDYQIIVATSNVNKTTGQLDITYTDTSGVEQTITWSGSGSTVNANVNSTHPTLEARIIRSSDEMRLLIYPGSDIAYVLDTDINIL